MTEFATIPDHQKTILKTPDTRILQRQCACGQHTHAAGECEECKKKRRKLGQSAFVPGLGQNAPAIVNDVLSSPGRSLDPALRADLEPRFGHDFSQVRVHTGAKAAASARAVNALAYTVGKNIVFASGRYAPATSAGRRLLAHELTHTIQQAQGVSSGVQTACALQVNTPGDPFERQAEAVASRLAAGQAIAPVFRQIQSGAAKLQRQADISQAPADLPCVLVAGPGHIPGTDVMFDLSSSVITAAQRAAITAFVRSWVAAGSRDDVIVDGWASVDGPQPLNWRLSCDRAESVKAELVAQGVPSGKITTFAHGESTEFSASSLTQNRRAIITTIPAVGPPPPTPTPPTPTPPTPTPPKPTPIITSQTVATSPGSRARTTIGVGEEVDLTHAAGSVAWSTTAGTLSAASGATVRLTAPDTAQNVVVIGGGATITFTVLAPTDVHMDRFPGTGIKHTKNQPDSGIETLPFLLPDDVNFYNVIYHELDAKGTPTTPGVYSCDPFSGGHCGHGGSGPCGDLAMTKTVVAGKGTQAVLGDCAYSGFCGTPPPFIPGSITITIPYEYKVGTGSFHRFDTVLQVHALAADASTLTSDKAGAHGSTTVASTSGAIPACP